MLTSAQRAALVLGVLALVATASLAVVPYAAPSPRVQRDGQISCGPPFLQAGQKDPRPQLENIRRLGRQLEDPPPPSEEDLARVGRLVERSDRFVACRQRGLRRTIRAIVGVLVLSVATLAALLLLRRRDGALSPPEVDLERPLTGARS